MSISPWSWMSDLHIRTIARRIMKCSCARNIKCSWVTDSKLYSARWTSTSSCEILSKYTKATIVVINIPHIRRRTRKSQAFSRSTSRISETELSTEVKFWSWCTRINTDISTTSEDDSIWLWSYSICTDESDIWEITIGDISIVPDRGIITSSSIRLKSYSSYSGIITSCTVIESLNSKRYIICWKCICRKCPLPKSWVTISFIIIEGIVSECIIIVSYSIRC
jgi:hypothetical protein